MRFVTGQLKSRKNALDFDELAVENQTLVFYMGLHTLPDIVSGLVGAGKDSATPIAIVSKGTCKDQQVLTGTLANIVERQNLAQLPGPALLIVGEVVKLQEKLAWFGEQAAVELPEYIEAVA